MKNTYNIIIIIKLNNQKTLIIFISYLCNCIIYQVAFVLMVNTGCSQNNTKNWESYLISKPKNACSA